MSPFEAGMMICFGFAWPISLVKSIRSRSTGGKSPLFSVVGIVGYLLGITHKIMYSFDLVLLLYCLNLAMVTADFAVWFRNKRLENSSNSCTN